MEYNAPFGEVDPDAPYINGDPSRGIQGSIPPAASIEYPQREIVGVISKSKVTPDNADLLQLTKTVRSQRLNFVEDTGSVDTLSCSLDPPLAAYTVGLIIRIRVANTNLGPVTIDAGAGRVPVRHPNGAAMQADELPAGGIANLVYDGAAFQLLSGGPTIISGGGPVTINYFTLPYCVDSSTTANIITAPFSPALTAQQAGTAFLVRISNTNTGPTTISVNSLPSKPVLENVNNQSLLPGDLANGSVVLFVFDGSNYYIAPNPLIPFSTTINIPARFSTLQTALNALSRKTIAYNAKVTLKLAAGIYPGMIDIYHKDADNIIIQGTMIGPNPTLGNFAQSGSGPTQRAQDALNNINMLRSRYGSEIQVPTAPFTSDEYGGGVYTHGIRNLSGGCPVVQDVLISSAAKTYAILGVRGTLGAPPNKTIALNNVAIWGCYRGIWTAAQIDCRYCSISNCVEGVVIGSNGALAAGHTYILGNDNYGVVASSNGFADCQFSACNCNGQYGLIASESAGILWEYSSSAHTNGYWDAYADTNSQITIQQNSSATSLNPPAFTLGNYNAMILVL